VSDVAFDPVDDRFVASGAWDDTARIWNLDTGDAVTFSGNGGKVWSVAFSPDGTSLFVGGDDGLIRIWSIATGAQIGQLAGHTEGVTSLTFMGGATQLVSTSWDSTARVWGLGRAITSQILPHPDTVVWSAAYNRQNGQIVTSAGDGSARVWATTP
jgi:WD40 repeat protein